MVSHHNQRVIDAASVQLNRFTHTLFGISPHERYLRLAERLAEKTPGDHAKKTMLVNPGPRRSRTLSRSAAHTGRRQSHRWTTPSTVAPT